MFTLKFLEGKRVMLTASKLALASVALVHASEGHAASYAISAGTNTFEASIDGTCVFLDNGVGGADCALGSGNTTASWVAYAAEPLNVLSMGYQILSFRAAPGFYAEVDNAASPEFENPGSYPSTCGLPSIVRDSTPATYTANSSSGEIAQGNILCGGEMIAERTSGFYEDSTYELTVEFEIVAEKLTPIPLPAGLPLLLAAIGGFGILKRRQ